MESKSWEAIVFFLNVVRSIDCECHCPRYIQMSYSFFTYAGEDDLRTFIAIDIDEKEIVRKLIELERLIQNTGAQMKLVEPENLHITLKFLGEIDSKDLQIIKQVVELHAKEFEPFEITIKGLGAFPSPGSPRVIWVGIDKNRDKVTDLASRISTDLERMGFRREERAFHPHITIARVKRYNAALKRILRENSDIEIGDFYVSKIRVKKSTLTPQGPIYTTILEVTL